MKKCDRCRRTNRALFTRLLSGGAYMVLCDICLRDKNAGIVKELRDLQERPRTAHHCRVRPRARTLKILDRFWRLEMPAGLDGKAETARFYA
jgi:hypothetical protein